MIDDNVIRNFVLRSNFYSFNIDNYRIPRVIISTHGRYIYIDSNKKLIESYGSKWEPIFKNDLDKFLETLPDIFRNKFKYIKEIPFIIEDRELWFNLCNEENVEFDRRDTNYFVADYYFPHFNFIVEIDSDFHNPRKNYDLARDKYMENKFGTSTLRFYQYGMNKEQTEIYQKEFLDLVNNKYKFNIKNNIVYDIQFDYSPTLIKVFKLKNSDVLIALNHVSDIIRKNGIKELYINNDSELEKLQYGLSNSKMKTIRVINLIFQLYGVKIKFNYTPKFLIGDKVEDMRRAHDTRLDGKKNF